MKTYTALVHAFVTSRLDYCNSLLYGINKELLNRLNQFFGPQLASSWKNGNSIRFQKISGTPYTGSRFAKESNSNSASSPSNVFTAMPHPIWPSRCRRWRSIRLSKPTGPPPAVTLWCLELEQLKWTCGVFLSRAQCSGTRFRWKFVITNILWSRSNQN